MTQADLARVESALAIRLPAAYHSVVSPFPIPACVGNSDTELWDDADRLIELNRELRAGISSVKPWPTHLFALGRDGSGSTSAIDLRDPSCPVSWADRCHLESAIGSVQPLFAEWASNYLSELRGDLESNGIDPDGSPAARAEQEEENARAGGPALLLLIAIAAAVVLVVFAIIAVFT